MIYFDYAATAPISPRAAAALTEAMSCFGNPSSYHTAGQDAKKRLDAARRTVAAALNADPNEIYFTSGGTEADNWAIHSAARAGSIRGKRHIISSAIEHHAVLHPLKSLEGQGFEVTLLPVYEDGLVRAADLEAALRDDTALVTIMYANNEIGTLQPIAELAALCRARGVPFHTDAVQAVGHVPIDVKAEQIDLLSLSGHKFGAPKGVGALYCRKGLPIRAWMEGGAQERGRRAGTENVPSIAAMAAALEESCAGMAAEGARLSALCDRLIEVLTALPRTRLNGHRTRRLPAIVNVCVEGIEGESMLGKLDRKGICASSGSACTSGSLDPSHVLLALGLPHGIAHGSLRLSLGAGTTEAEIDQFLADFPPIVAYLRNLSPVWDKDADAMIGT